MFWKVVAILGVSLTIIRSVLEVFGLGDLALFPEVVWPFLKTILPSFEFLWNPLLHSAMFQNCRFERLRAALGICDFFPTDLEIVGWF